MAAAETTATIREIRDYDGTVKSVFEDVKADLFIKTGKTNGKHFLVTVNRGPGESPTLIAIHL